MFCENCGNRLPDGAKFCGSCGVKTGPVQPVYKVPAQPSPEPREPSPAYTAQQSYAHPRPASYNASIHTDAVPLSVGQYIGMYLLMCVPLLNIILLFIWSFGKSVMNPNKKNFARASLILFAVASVLYVVILIVYLIVFGAIKAG
jgi:hypothetical protein